MLFYFSDAILICLGDTLMSVLAGFSVFAMMGVLSNELDTDIEKVITSGKQTLFLPFKRNGQDLGQPYFYVFIIYIALEIH